MHPSLFPSHRLEGECVNKLPVNMQTKTMQKKDGCSPGWFQGAEPLTILVTKMLLLSV